MPYSQLKASVYTTIDEITLDHSLTQDGDSSLKNTDISNQTTRRKLKIASIVKNAEQREQVLSQLAITQEEDKHLLTEF
jgi:hypothetical protein